MSRYSYRLCSYLKSEYLLRLCNRFYCTNLSTYLVINRMLTDIKTCCPIYTARGCASHLTGGGDINRPCPLVQQTIKFTTKRLPEQLCKRQYYVTMNYALLEVFFYVIRGSAIASHSYKTIPQGE